MSNVIVRRSIRKLPFKRKGAGIINTLINKLPVELHIPGYNFCGPGTKLDTRLRRGDTGVNLLDEACREHDISYSLNKDLEERHKADQKLYEASVRRIKSKDAGIGEKIAATAVAGIMKAKTKFGMGVKQQIKSGSRKQYKRRKRMGGVLSFPQAIKKARQALGHGKNRSLLQNAKAAFAALRKGNKTILAPRRRVIPIPKRGGFLPLIPLFAALGALGSLGGGAAAIAKAVNDAKAGREQLQEAERHNRAMEAKAVGSGFYIKPYKTGCGLYFPTSSKNL